MKVEGDLSSSSAQSKRVSIEHKIGCLGRVEGESAVRFEMRDGRLESLELNIWEPPRFFEAMLTGRRFDEVPDIVARICGICPVSHMVTAIRALGKALGIVADPRTVALQRLMAQSQLVASHLVHLYVLAMPDFFGRSSVVEMMPRSKPELERFLRMKEVLNQVGAAFGGRAQHPVAMVVAGFLGQPGAQVVSGLLRRLEELREDALETVNLIAGLEVPELATPDEFTALAGPDEYGLNRGRLISDQGMNGAEEDYLSLFTEEQVPYANAKRTMVKGRKAPMVGALARVNLQFDRLHPAAREAAARAGFRPPSRNPFHNNLAQAIEVVHGIHECIDILSNLPESRPLGVIAPRAGRGEAVTEAPRGLLYHSYVLDEQGMVTAANIVTPTAHNFLSLEQNLRLLIESCPGESRDEIARRCEMLVRAYDPCFSCSVH